MESLLGTLLMVRSFTKMTSIVRNKIMEVSLSAASFLNGDELAQLKEGDNKEGGAHYASYLSAYNTLAKFKTNSVDNNAGLAYIYCIYKTEDNRYVFSIDPSEDPGEFLKEETITTKALERAFEGTAGFDTQSYVDRWGDLYSAYAPVKSSDGTVKTVVGVDVWASWYKKEIASNAIMIGIVTLSTVILGAGVAIIIITRMRKRIDALSEEMDELQGDIHSLIEQIREPSYIQKNKEEEEYEGDGSIANLRKQINSTRSAVKDYIVYARQQAYVDSLSGLGNRNAYFEVVNDINQKIVDKVYQNFAVIVFDINGLKLINDEYGHEIGDKAIIASGNTLKELFGKDISYRIGGDELVVIYKNVYKDKIEAILSILDVNLANNSKEQQLPFELSLSYGYSFFDEEKDTRYEDVFNRADDKMYAQKSAFYETHKINRRRKH